MTRPAKQPRIGPPQPQPKRYRESNPHAGTTRRHIRMPNYIDRELVEIAETNGMQLSQAIQALFNQGKAAKLPLFEK